MKKSNKKNIKRKGSVKEQVRDVKVHGLPNPSDLASKIANSGSSAEEIMGWLGAVLSRAGITPTTETEVEISKELPEAPPMPSIAAVEEQLENDLLDELLREIKQSTQRKK